MRKIKIDKTVLFGLLISIGIAIFFAPFASQFPDGLEKVAEIKKFLHISENKTVLHSLIPDYLFPGIKSETVATSVAGAVGTFMVFVISYILFGLLKRKK